MPEKKQYYCGPDWWWFPDFLRRLASVRVNASCKIHDLDYTAPHKFTRLEADTRFLAHMLRQSRGSLFWECAALAYFLATRIAGRLSWGAS